MPLVSKKVFFGSFTFLVDENVYEPAEDSFLFAENLDIDESSKIVDVGAGCGILSIIAAKKAREVFSVDINKYAILCAYRNAEANGLADKIFFVQGDLLSSFAQGTEFDMILFNAPYLQTEKEESSLLECSWAGGQNGRDVIDRFIDQAPEYLSAKGHILLMQSSLSGIEQTFQRFTGKGLAVESIARQTLPFFEEIVLMVARNAKK